MVKDRQPATGTSGPYMLTDCTPPPCQIDLFHRWLTHSLPFQTSRILHDYPSSPPRKTTKAPTTSSPTCLQARGSPSLPMTAHLNFQHWRLLRGQGTSSSLQPGHSLPVSCRTWLAANLPALYLWPFHQAEIAYIRDRLTQRRAGPSDVNAVLAAHQRALLIELLYTGIARHRSGQHGHRRSLGRQRLGSIATYGDGAFSARCRQVRRVR